MKEYGFSLVDLNGGKVTSVVCFLDNHVLLSFRNQEMRETDFRLPYEQFGLFCEAIASVKRYLPKE
jgi:hypothetical protein